MYRRDRTNVPACLLAALLIGALLSGCGGASSSSSSMSTSNTSTACTGTAASGGAAYDLTVNGSGYTPHNGQHFAMAVADTGTPTVLISHTSCTFPTTGSSLGNFTFTFPGALAALHSYNIYYYADENQNGQCDMFPTDHEWEDTSLVNVTTSATVTVTHNTNFTSVCSFMTGL